MKAALLHNQAPVESHPLSIEEIDHPLPGEGEVLIRVRVCGVCRTDLHVVEGDLDSRRSPLIPGHQVVGEIVEHGAGVTAPAIGARVGVAWLNRTCGCCSYCASGRENLCDAPAFTGWTADGGFAEHMVAPAEFVYEMPPGFEDLQAAPLLCAGIIGYRSLKLTGLTDGGKLGIYGFGAAGHVVIQLARARGMEVYVCTRDRERHQALATELGAAWVGDTVESPPVKLDASIVFAPAGEIVPPALAALTKGGSLVLGGIHMSPIPEFEYSLLYGERLVRSVANNTREDGRAFLEEAARIGIQTSVQRFGLDDVNEALCALKNDAIRGAAVIEIG